MSHVILENVATGQLIEAPPAGSVPQGWKIKGVVVTRKAEPWTAKLAVWSQKLGLPTADFLDAARWLLEKDCAYCQLGTQVLRQIDNLGDKRAERLLTMILEAKKVDDRDSLERIRKDLWSSESPELHQQS